MQSKTIEISTGAVVPDGADAVIPIEYVVEHDNEVEVGERVDEGANVRPRGGDVRQGDEVVATGTHVGATQLGALAACGLAEVACASRPRASVRATGTEFGETRNKSSSGRAYEKRNSLVKLGPKV